MIALRLLRVLVQHHLGGLTQQIHLTDGAHAVGRLHQRVLLGRPLDEVGIGLLLIFQAAHEPAAGAGDLGGIEGEILGLGHLDGHGVEVAEEGGAAVGSAADAQASQHFRLVPDAHLTQLNPGAEDAGQVLDQGPEVHPALSGEEEEDLAAVKAVLHLNELHLQLVLGNLLLTDLEGPGLLLFVFLLLAEIGLRGNAEHRAEGGDELHLVDHGVALGADGALQTVGGLQNDVLPLRHLQAVGVEKVFFSAAFKADADDFGHVVSSDWIGVNAALTTGGFRKQFDCSRHFVGADHKRPVRSKKYNVTSCLPQSPTRSPQTTLRCGRGRRCAPWRRCRFWSNR